MSNDDYKKLYVESQAKLKDANFDLDFMIARNRKNEELLREIRKLAMSV